MFVDGSSLCAPNFGDRKGTTKKLCDKDLAERSGELSGAICLKTLVLLGNDLVAQSNCSEDSLVLFVRFFGFVGPFWLLKIPQSQSLAISALTEPNHERSRRKKGGV